MPSESFSEARQNSEYRPLGIVKNYSCCQSSSPLVSYSQNQAAFIGEIVEAAKMPAIEPPVCFHRRLVGLSKME